MKEFDEIDEKIENILKADIYEPLSYTNTIKNALRKTEKKTLSLPKLIAAIIAGAMIISGVVYAKQIGEFIRRFFNENKGVDTAVEYGYIDQIDVEFDSTSDTKVSINSLLMDDYNISFILVFNFNETYNNISSVSIPDLLIADEAKNILYCIDENKFNEFCKNNNLNLNFYKYNDSLKNSSLFKSQTYNTKQVSFNIKSTTPYLKSKQLLMEFNHIVVTIENGETKDIFNEWKTNIDVANIFYNREKETYKLVESNNILISNFKFEIYNTGTFLEFDAQLKPYITDEMTDIEKNKRKEEFLTWVLKPKENYIKEIIIQNNYGQTYQSSNSNFDDTSEDYSYDGKFHYKNTLELTKYDLTDELTVYFTINTINENRDVVLKLEKMAK